MIYNKGDKMDLSIGQKIKLHRDGDTTLDGVVLTDADEHGHYRLDLTHGNHDWSTAFMGGNMTIEIDEVTSAQPSSLGRWEV